MDLLTILEEYGKEQFSDWANKVNENLQKHYGLSIKDNPNDPWDIQEQDEFTIFLDIKYKFSADKGLITDINIKPTDARAYLHYTSCHPRHTFPSIVYSQALRYRRIINQHETLLTRLEELKTCFMNSGYPKKMVSNIMDDVSKKPRCLEYSKKPTEPPFPVLWVQTYGSGTEALSQIAKKANDILQESPVWKGTKRPIGLINRRDQNLGDLLLQKKRLALQSNDSKGTIRCTPVTGDSERRKRGRPCASCDMMSSTDKITSNINGKSFRVPNGNCQTRSLIYMAQCSLCKVQYVGQTTTPLRERISGHRSWMKKKKDNNDVVDQEGKFKREDEAVCAEHIKNSHGCQTTSEFNSVYKFTVLALNPSAGLDKAEQQWISNLVTMVPCGLNIAKPCGVADGQLTMHNKRQGQG